MARCHDVKDKHQPRDGSRDVMNYGRMGKKLTAQARTDLQREIGQRMLWARELVEPNRTEVARWLGAAPSMLTKNENGGRAPSIWTIIEYANRLRVSTDYLLRGQLVGQMDEEMRVKLAALHPELVLGQKGRVERTDMAPASGKHRKPRKLAPAD